MMQLSATIFAATLVNMPPYNFYLTPALRPVIARCSSVSAVLMAYFNLRMIFERVGKALKTAQVRPFFGTGLKTGINWSGPIPISCSQFTYH
jgi:hypothetical protein